MTRVALPSLRATRALAFRLAKGLTGQDLLLLSGELGAGKTTFVHYLAQAMGLDPAWVSSPSFTLVQRYPAEKSGIGITHADLYRVSSGAGLESLGLDDVLASGDLVIVEWPQAAEPLWASSGRRVMHIAFGFSEDGRREARVEG